MTQREPSGPYVYAPYGSISHPEHDSCNRLWGVSGVHMLCTIKGLTKDEAEKITRVLQGVHVARKLARDAKGGE